MTRSIVCVVRSLGSTRYRDDGVESWVPSKFPSRRRTRKSAFVRDAVLREAESVMAAELTVTLSPAESRRFLKALDAPFKPNARLKKAMQDAAKLIR